MTVIDKLMLASGHWNAILYAGATLFAVGLVVGIVVALVLTSVARRHGAFYIMLEEESARARAEAEQSVELAKAYLEVTEADIASIAMHKKWDDNYDDEPEDWDGGDPWMTVADATPDEDPEDCFFEGSNYVIAAEAVTA